MAAEQQGDPQEPARVEIQASASVGPVTENVRLSVRYADEILVKESATLKKIHTPTGPLFCHQSVFFVVSGNDPTEITRDASPEEVEAYQAGL